MDTNKRILASTYAIKSIIYGSWNVETYLTGFLLATALGTDSQLVDWGTVFVLGTACVAGYDAVLDVAGSELVADGRGFSKDDRGQSHDGHRHDLGLMVSY